jgi:hypothetical protein
MPFTVNHDWNEVEEALGVVIDAQRLSLETAPDKFVNNYAKKSNRSILKADGWMPVAGKVVFRNDNEILDQLSMGMGNKVSIGGFNVTDYWCPICRVSFEDRSVCSHVPPSMWYEDTDKTMPYIVRKDVDDMGEVSLCLIPNAPSCGAITNDIAEYFKDYV